MYGTFKGLIPAAFSPMKSDGSINPGAVKSITEKLINDGIDGILVNGSTGNIPPLPSTSAWSWRRLMWRQLPGECRS